MSAQPFEAPRMREVFNRDDVDQVSRRLQQQRFGAFLAAKDLLLTKLHTGAENVTRLAEKYHCGPALRLAGRVCGWLLGGLGRLRRAVRTPGVLSSAVYLLTTPLGGRWLTQAAGFVGRVTRQAGTALARAGAWFLGLFGKRGVQVAEMVAETSRRISTSISTKVGAVRAVATAFLPDGLVVRLVRTVARERALKAVLGHFLGRRTALVVRVLMNAVLLPLSLGASTLLPRLRPQAAQIEEPFLRDISKPAEQTQEGPTDEVEGQMDLDLAATGTDDVTPEAPAFRPPTKRSPHAKKRK